MGTVHIRTEGKKLSLSEDNLVIRDCNDSQLIPLSAIDGIIFEGDITITSPLLCRLIEFGVQMTFLNFYGGYKCSIHPDIKGNVVVRHNQVRLFDDTYKALELAKSVIVGKCLNQISVIDRDIRNYSSTSELGNGIIEKMKTYVNLLKSSDSKVEIMGYEGAVAREYFSYFNNLIRKDGFTFNGRSYNPPEDEVNSALSYIYTLLRHEVEKAILICGLDPYIGFLHSDSSGKPSLALDLMEEFRPFLCDRVIISMINNRQLDKQDFISKNSGIYIGKSNRNAIIKQWEAKKRSKVKNNGKLETYSDIILSQVRLLVKHIKGIDEYKSYLWR